MNMTHTQLLIRLQEIRSQLDEVVEGVNKSVKGIGWNYAAEIPMPEVWNEKLNAVEDTVQDMRVSCKTEGSDES